MAIIGLCRSVVTALVVLVLAYVNCSPLRAPRQVSNPSIGVLHETLDVAKNILVSFTTHNNCLLCMRTVLVKKI